jgi:3-deoxy-D-manno-octulosonic-acid transferase
VKVTGSLKFDAVVPGQEQPSEAARLIPAGRPVLVVGSSLAPEEEIVLEAFKALRSSHPDLFLVLAPRHPDRFQEVAELASLHGLKVIKRTSLTEPPVGHDVMVLDTIGELASIYGRADVVFVGGSLAPWGGHNLVEPAIVSRPIVFGPNMSNFREMAKMFLEADAAVQVVDREALREALERLMGDAALRSSLGEKARRLVDANRGAGRKTVDIALEVANKGR